MLTIFWFDNQLTILSIDEPSCHLVTVTNVSNNQLVN